jgi:hypothetical protein
MGLFTHPANAEESNWCFSPIAPHSELMRNYDDIHLLEPNVSDLGNLRGLINNSVIESSHYGGNGNRIYYIRAGVLAPPGLSNDDLYNHILNTRFQILFNDENGDLLISSFRSFAGPKQNYNIVLRVESRNIIRRSFVACYGTD